MFGATGASLERVAGQGEEGCSPRPLPRIGAPYFVAAAFAFATKVFNVDDTHSPA